jgi:hypothetical protein
MPSSAASPTPETDQRQQSPQTQRSGGHPDPVEDRWAWRAKVKRNPATRRVYRFAVGLVGTLLILAAIATGWLPGPGGIPLALAGLAVLASEFAWAERLLDRVKDALRSASDWTRRQPGWVQRMGAVLTLALVLAGVYLYLLALGVPGWLPDGVQAPLQSLPGLR